MILKHKPGCQCATCLRRDHPDRLVDILIQDLMSQGWTVERIREEVLGALEKVQS